MKKFSLASLSFMGMAFMGMLSLSACSGDDTPDNPGNKGDELPILKQHNNDAVLLVTFGSTFDEPQKTYEAEKAFFKEKFPKADHYFSFTSRTIINRMMAKDAYFLPPKIYLQTFLRNNNYKNVYVQSLHVIPGEEYTLLRDDYVKKEYNVQLIDMNPKELKGRNRAVCGEPLLGDVGDDENIAKVAKVLVDDHAADLKAGDAVVFVGHGNPELNYSQANDKYVALQDAMQKYGKEKYNSDLLYVGTVEGKVLDKNKKPMEIGYEYIYEQIAALPKKPNKIHLQILMSIAGDHANNDMAGTATEEDGQKLELEDQSWLNRFKAAGYEVAVQRPLKALGDYPELRQIWYENLRKAIEKSKEGGEE